MCWGVNTYISIFTKDRFVGSADIRRHPSADNVPVNLLNLRLEKKGAISEADCNLKTLINKYRGYEYVCLFVCLYWVSI